MQLNSRKILLTVIVLATTCFVAFQIASFSVLHSFKYKYSISSTPENASSTPKILLVWDRGIGEQDTIARLKITSKNLGVDLRDVSDRPPYYIRWFIKDPVTLAAQEFQPDLILTIQDYVKYYNLGIPNYMTLTLGTDRYLELDKNGVAKIINPELLKFDALLPSFKDINLLQSVYERDTGKEFIGFSWYPSAYMTEYTPAIPKKLLYSGGFKWDSTRGSEKYLSLYKQLDATGYFQVSGPKRKWKDIPNSSIGLLPADGVAMIDAIHKAGVSLVFHHRQHIDGGAPTSRIFEAAAANAVIISDRHPFVVEHFGDNVLYVDIDQDVDVMFKQIDDHMQWILANPTKAQQMADRCHTIANDFFSLELMLGKLIELHCEHVKTIEPTQG